MKLIQGNLFPFNSHDQHNSFEVISHLVRDQFGPIVKVLAQMTSKWHSGSVPPICVGGRGFDSCCTAGKCICDEHECFQAFAFKLCILTRIL